MKMYVFNYFLDIRYFTSVLNEIFLVYNSIILTMSNLKSTITCSFYIYVKFHNIFLEDIFTLDCQISSFSYVYFISFKEYSNIDTLKSLKPVNLMRAKN